MNHTLLNNQERARQLRIRVENITIPVACRLFLFPVPFNLFPVFQDLEGHAGIL
mgnify:CR=1 FL=1